MLFFAFLLACTPSCPEPSCDTSAPCPEEDTAVDSGDTDQPPDSGDTGAPSLTVADLDPFVRPSDLWVEPMDPAPGSTATVHYCGELAWQDEVQLHYGFDGWVEGAHDLPMSKDGAACQVADLSIPEGASVIHMVFRAGDRWDDRGGLDWHWSLDFPYAGPWLTLAEDGGLTVHWETSVPCLGVVEHGPTEALGTLVVGEERTRLHQLTLHDLSPGSWFYRVHDSAGHHSATFEVQVVDPGAEDLSVVVGSDMQDHGRDERWDEVAAAMGEAHPELLVFAGDLAADDTPGLWWLFFHQGAELLARVPMAATTGNHDTPREHQTSSFRRWMGRDPVYEALELGPLHLLLLDSEHPEEMVGSGVQAAFTEAELASAPEGWVVAAWHIPPYNAGVRHEAEQHEVRGLTELLDGRLDWVFTGHEHLYQRFKPLRYDAQLVDTYGRGADEGVGYTVLPPAGNRCHDQIVAAGSDQARYRDRLAYPPVTEGSDRVSSEQGFVTMELSADTMTLNTWGMGTIDAPREVHLVDQVTVSR